MTESFTEEIEDSSTEETAFDEQASAVPSAGGG